MSATLLIRNTSKNSWAQAAKLEMLDSPLRLSELTEGMNEQAGFAKYKADPAELEAYIAAQAAAVDDDTPPAEELVDPLELPIKDEDDYIISGTAETLDELDNGEETD